ncbi:MAG: aminopeptidase P family protein [Rhizobiaceae bacterium]
MFQSFEDFSDPSASAARISRLRARMMELEVDGFLVPRADEHQGEYVAPRSERLRWLTGFSGSAGTALILADTAILFVDGRYTLQVREQTDGALFEYENLVDTPPAKWLKANAENGFRLAVDPWLHTIRDTRLLKKALEKAGGQLIAVESNPVDEIWSDQPAPPLRPVELHEHRYCGKLAVEKLAEMAEALRDAGLSHTVLTDPSSIAWSFNIRGSDVPHTPLVLSFAIIAADGNHQLFIDKRKLPIKEEAYLTQLCELREPDELADTLAKASADGGQIGLDEQLAAEKLNTIVGEAGGSVVAFADPARLPRACKNEAEIAGARDAHRRDAVAVIRFLHWLDSQEAGSVDEIAAAKRLEGFRTQTGDEHQMPLRDISFDTITGAGPNGAIIHYRVTTASNRMLESNALYLVDSGGQYSDGTTDITRTVAIGEPDDQMRRHYTIVLKGLIAISKARFPVGTRGMDIDPLARIAHWNAGIDYAHGTGHGVGSFLSVHEGPQRIARTGTEKLLPGMILSNEPGYYREGEYGIRLENLILVEPPSPVTGGDIEMHAFETLTLAPFDRRLIKFEMLTDEERRWLNGYHRRVESEIGPMIEGQVSEWLRNACAPS